jgi:hypothetical protein
MNPIHIAAIVTDNLRLSELKAEGDFEIFNLPATEIQKKTKKAGKRVELRRI